MAAVFGYILIVLILLVALIFGATALVTAQATLVVANAKAEAILIDANTRAFVWTTIALLPWGVLVVVGVLLTIKALKKPALPSPNIVVQLPALARRRDVWNLIQDVQPASQLPWTEMKTAEWYKERK